MRKILLSLAIAFIIQAGAQTDTVMFRHLDDGTVDTLSISRIDSITFGYAGGCNGLTTLTYNGYTYDLVGIGNQCWFKENLQTTKYRDGTPINYPGNDTSIWNNNTTGAYAWYDNDTAYASTYGALYNFYAANKSLCPTGWHVPSHSEWILLESYLEANGYNFDGSTSGNLYAKAMADTVLWNPATGVGEVGNTDYSLYRNKSGFSGLPGGYRHSGGGNYLNRGGAGYWWSSTGGSSLAWDHSISFNSREVDIFVDSKEAGFSVRCLKY